MAETRIGFAPTVLAGLATGALTVVAATRPWYAADVTGSAAVGVPDADTVAEMPLALALGLVVLATWGVVLVTRGGVRRAVAGLGVVAAVGVLAAGVAAATTLPGQIRDRLPDGVDADLGPTAWFVVAMAAGVASVVVLVWAWLRIPRWPTMSSRYDAPSTRRVDPTGTPEDPREMWRTLDEGRDPTQGPDAPTTP